MNKLCSILGYIVLPILLLCAFLTWCIVFLAHCLVWPITRFKAPSFGNFLGVLFSKPKKGTTEMAHASHHCSPCMLAARRIRDEVDTISAIDITNQTAETSLAVIEAKRAIINAQLDEMVKSIKSHEEARRVTSIMNRG